MKARIEAIRSAMWDMSVEELDLRVSGACRERESDED